jgi:hypothetical protein
MASTAKQQVQIINARVTYALSLYFAELDNLGVRESYDRACRIAALNLADRAQFRTAVYRGAR